MRWKDKKDKYEDGETRTVTRFLLFPKKLPIYSVDIRETRWLEMGQIIQKYIKKDKKWVDWRWPLIG